MLRWKYIVPRLSTLILTCCAIYFGMNPLLRWAIILGGQSITGARVDVGALHASAARGNLTIENLAMADPSAPRRNLVEIGQANFDVESKMLLHRKLVIRESRLDQIVLRTDRETDGRLEKSPEETKPGGGLAGSLQQLGKRGEDWFDASKDKWEGELENELETVKLGRELKERWPEDYRALAERAKVLEHQGRDLRDLIQEVKDKPLEHLDKVQPMMASVDRLRTEGLDLRTRVQRLQQQMRDDRLAIDEARRHDTAYIRERFRLDELDGNSLSEYLLGPVWSQRVQTALGWIEWSRQLTTEHPAERYKNSHRGTDFLFPGIPAMPDVLIRAMHLSGQGTSNQQDYTFTGTIRDLTYQPRRHDAPATIEIHTEGAIEAVAHGTLDRRGDQPVDEWVIDVPSWKQNGERLGSDTQLAVKLSPGTARLHAELTLRGKSLSGKVTMLQEKLVIEPQLDQRYAKFVSPQSLQSAVANIQQLRAEMDITGELLKPHCRLKSNLGPELAQGLNRAMKQELAAREEQLLNKANQEVVQQLDKLQQDLLAEHGDILKQLELGDKQMEQIRGQLTASLGSPSDLIRKGKKLLFK